MKYKDVEKYERHYVRLIRIVPMCFEFSIRKFEKRTLKRYEIARGKAADLLQVIEWHRHERSLRCKTDVGQTAKIVDGLLNDIGRSSQAMSEVDEVDGTPPTSPQSDVGRFIRRRLSQSGPLASQFPGLDGLTDKEAAALFIELTQTELPQSSDTPAPNETIAQPHSTQTLTNMPVENNNDGSIDQPEGAQHVTNLPEQNRTDVPSEKPEHTPYVTSIQQQNSTDGPNEQPERNRHVTNIQEQTNAGGLENNHSDSGCSSSIANEDWPDPHDNEWPGDDENGECESEGHENDGQNGMMTTTENVIIQPSDEENELEKNIAQNNNENKTEEQNEDLSQRVKKRFIPPSNEVENYEGKFIPQNTINNNNSVRNALIRFLNADSRFNVTIDLGDENGLFNYLLPCSPTNVTDEHLHFLNNFLKEFIVHYKTAGNGCTAKPGTMWGYLQGFARLLKARKFTFDIHKHSIFTDEESGYRQVMDNFFAKQQSEGATTKHHNTMVLSDIKKLLCHPVCSEKTASGYLNKLVLTFGLLLGLRPTALSQVVLDQFELTERDGKPIFIYEERIGGRDGTSKTKQGGIKYIKRSPLRIPIHNMELVDGLLNPFSLVVDYFNIRLQMGPFSNRFFLQLAKKPDGKKRIHWFKKMAIGKNSFKGMVTDMCNAAGVKGTGLQNHMTDHGLRATMISQLIAAGHSDSSIILRTGHSSVDTLARYHNLQGVEGFKQQMGIFNSAFNTMPFNHADLKPFCEEVEKSNAIQPDVKPSEAHADQSASSIDQSKQGVPLDVGNLGTEPQRGISNEGRVGGAMGFATSVGTISTTGGQISVTINNYNGSSNKRDG